MKFSPSLGLLFSSDHPNPPDDLIETTAAERLAAMRRTPNEMLAVMDGKLIVVPKPPEALADVKLRLSNSVDSAIADIYAKYTRFSDEYRMRETEAQAFLDAGYTGPMGPLVNGYAVTRPDLSPQQATDAIIAQAANLRAALTGLGNLRMRKNEIKAPSVLNAAEAQLIYDDILAECELIVATLG